jgi:hypothetical protein
VTGRRIPASGSIHGCFVAFHWSIGRQGPKFSTGTELCGGFDEIGRESIQAVPFNTRAGRPTFSRQAERQPRNDLRASLRNGRPGPNPIPADLKRAIECPQSMRLEFTGGIAVRPVARRIRTPARQSGVNHRVRPGFVAGALSITKNPNRIAGQACTITRLFEVFKCHVKSLAVMR